MDQNQSARSFGPFASSAVEAVYSRRAAQQAEREAREAREDQEVPHNSGTIASRLSAAQPIAPPVKPSLMIKLNIKFRPTAAYKELPVELRWKAIDLMRPNQRMLDLRLQPMIKVDPSLATRSPMDTETTVERNKNSATHTLAFGQGAVRAEPPVALSIDRVSRARTLETYKLLRQPLPRLNGALVTPYGQAYFDPEVDILHCGSRAEYTQAAGGTRKGPTISSFHDKTLIQRIAVPIDYFSTINYTIGPRPVLLKYPALKEIIVLVPHLKICIHGNEVRTSIKGLRHPKEFYVDKFKVLVQGKWGVEMRRIWGVVPWIRFVGSCRCDRPIYRRRVGFRG
ncbi:hypothetical protein OCU04_008542 [Sclerotinia nivalis]|uniref:2EXR domain-containing protein n=1 Tax=Sclerotinia nivalis TaxID=352851 RepID=A0A9X0AIA1_9HELO|nr:hypothetical protein OCU04_008542 [Sclerotinia nivalis]